METRFFRTYKRKCKEIGKSVSAVASELGFSSGSCTAWKQGRAPKMETIEEIAKYFNCDIEDFFLSDGSDSEDEKIADNIFYDGVMLGRKLEKEKPTVSGELSDNAIYVAKVFDSLPQEVQSLLREKIEILAKDLDEPHR